MCRASPVRGTAGGRVNIGAPCRIVAGGPVSGEKWAVPPRRLLMRGGNLSMLQVNPVGNLAVLGSDERRNAGRDARRCDGRGADGVMKRAEGMRTCTHPTPGAAPNVAVRTFLSKYARGSQLVLRHS